MDDLIEKFFESYITEELQAQLYKSLGLFTVFGLTNIHQELPDIIMQEQEEHKEVIIDQVHAHINKGLDTLLGAQRIRLGEDASLRFKNNFLEALFAFNYREDYTPYQKIMEDWMSSDEDKLASIVADIQGVDPSDIMEHLDWVYSGTMDTLKEYVNEKAQEESEAADMPLLRKIRRNLKAFEKAFGTPSSVQGLSEINMSMGSPFQTYLELFREAVINLGDMEGTTYNLIWLATISEDGTENPQKLLLEVSESLFPDHQQQRTFGAMLQKAMGRYQEYRKHES